MSRGREVRRFVCQRCETATFLEMSGPDMPPHWIEVKIDTAPFALSGTWDLCGDCWDLLRPALIAWSDEAAGDEYQEEPAND